MFPYINLCKTGLVKLLSSAAPQKEFTPLKASQSSVDTLKGIYIYEIYGIKKLYKLEQQKVT